MRDGPAARLVCTAGNGGDAGPRQEAEHQIPGSDVMATGIHGNLL